MSFCGCIRLDLLKKTAEIDVSTHERVQKVGLREIILRQF